MRRWAALLLAVLGLQQTGFPALAQETQPERLIASLSTHRLQIASNFVGAEIVLFGAIGGNGTLVERPGGYALAVVVRGPRATIVPRRKERVLGIWMNMDAREFVEVPSAYAVLSNRPVANLAPLELRQRHNIGLDALILLQRTQVGRDAETSAPFREAFLRLNLGRGVYREAANGVTFLTPTLFRATIPVSPNTPVGAFDVDVFLFTEGRLRTEETTNFEIAKTITQHVREQGVIRRMTVAVLVDGNTTGAGAERQWQPRSEEELQRLTALVRNRIGFDQRRGDTIEVANLRFYAPEELPVDTTEPGLFDFSKQDIMRIAEVFVMAIVALLVMLAAPRYMGSVDRARESALKENLFQMRAAIDKFYADRSRYPTDLRELVEQRYLRSIPPDPLTDRSDTWVAVTVKEQAGGGISNVRSGASGRALDGSQYASW